jgi:translation initiation factor 1 (eIF-1/SUI1)
MSRKRTKITGDNAALSTNPFAAALGDLAGPPETETEPSAAEPEPDDPAPLDLGRRAIVRRQSKGQGGKTVTCVEGLPDDTASEFVALIKQELGCSGRIRDGVLILGTRDHARVAAWLRDAGVPRVTLGN